MIREWLRLLANGVATGDKRFGRAAGDDQREPPEDERGDNINN
jgi:hypothetical protein